MKPTDLAWHLIATAAYVGALWFALLMGCSGESEDSITLPGLDDEWYTVDTSGEWKPEPTESATALSDPDELVGTLDDTMTRVCGEGPVWVTFYDFSDCPHAGPNDPNPTGPPCARMYGEWWTEWPECGGERIEDAD